MFLPLHDQNPLKIIPFQFVTISIIVICVAVFIWQTSLSSNVQNEVSFAYGMIPAVLFNLKMLPPDIAQLPAEITLLTYMFLHGDWWHLIGNMLFLWVFGDNIEDSMGHLRFAVFYLLCGIGAAFVHGIIEPDAVIPIIGASGAVAGILGAYVVLHPKVKILVLIFGRIPLRLPAYWLIAAWVIFQIISIYLDTDRQVAWWAHIGGFIVGAILIILFRDKQIPLFDRGETH